MKSACVSTSLSTNYKKSCASKNFNSGERSTELKTIILWPLASITSDKRTSLSATSSGAPTLLGNSVLSLAVMITYSNFGTKSRPTFWVSPSASSLTTRASLPTPISKENSKSQLEASPNLIDSVLLSAASTANALLFPKALTRRTLLEKSSVMKLSTDLPLVKISI